MLGYNEVKPNLNLLSFAENAQTHGRKVGKSSQLGFLQSWKKKIEKNSSSLKKRNRMSKGVFVTFYTKKAFALEARTKKLCQGDQEVRGMVGE